MGFCYSRLNTILPSTATSSSITLGVSATETSISGNFFVGFPRTYFFDPDAVSKFKCCTSALGEPFTFLAGRLSRVSNYDCRTTQGPEDGHWMSSGFNDCSALKALFKKRIEDCRGVATIHWVVRMLHHHMHIQKSLNTALAEDDTSLQIHFDKHTNGIRIPGYEFVGRRRPGSIDPRNHTRNQIPYGVRVVLSKPRQKNSQRFTFRYSTLPLKPKVAAGVTVAHGFVQTATVPITGMCPAEKGQDEYSLDERGPLNEPVATMCNAQQGGVGSVSSRTSFFVRFQINTTQLNTTFIRRRMQLAPISLMMWLQNRYLQQSATSSLHRTLHVKSNGQEKTTKKCSNNLVDLMIPCSHN